MFLGTLLMAAILVTSIPSLTDAHARMLDPPSRMSAYILGFNTPVNFNDHEMFCGGRAVQWQQNGGKCGICGDPWSGPRLYERPDGAMVQHNVITKVYVEGSTITIQTQVTANHLGWVEFRLCDIASTGGVEATQACLDQTLLTNQTGKTRFEIGGSTPGFYTYTVVLPRGFICEHCMLQYKWNAGNDWNCDETGCGIGLGPQEQFYACADITISPPNGFSETTTKSTTTTTSTTTTRPTTTTTQPTTTTTRTTTTPTTTTAVPVTFKPELTTKSIITTTLIQSTTTIPTTTTPTTTTTTPTTTTPTTTKTTTPPTANDITPTYFNKFNFFKNYTASTMAKLNYPTASPKVDPRTSEFYSKISALPDVNNSYYNGNFTKAYEDTTNRVCAYCKMVGCFFDCSSKCPDICANTYFNYNG